MKNTLPIVERFHSLQGEGAHVGKSAFFIRLASCKVRCPWCDTKQSWSENAYPKIDIFDLSQSVVEARTNGANFVVLTGGEPLHHNLGPLCEAIRQETKTERTSSSISIHLETSGVDPLSGKPDWVTLSPKPHAPPKIDVLSACDELKIIINDQTDLIFAEEMASQIKEHSDHKTLFFLQAVWNNKQAQNLTYEYVKNNSEWRLSIQTHKWLGIQ
tara:strand:- start:130 stop:774 length:645 start_codon:yes stop_codon:yes gene_type:complete